MKANLASPIRIVIDQTLGDASISYGRGEYWKVFYACVRPHLIEVSKPNDNLKNTSQMWPRNGKKGNFDLAALKTNRKILGVISDTCASS